MQTTTNETLNYPKNDSQVNNATRNACNVRYLKRAPGILKLVQLALVLLALGLVLRVRHRLDTPAYNTSALKALNAAGYLQYQTKPATPSSNATNPAVKVTPATAAVHSGRRRRQVIPEAEAAAATSPQTTELAIPTTESTSATTTTTQTEEDLNKISGLLEMGMPGELYFIVAQCVALMFLCIFLATYMCHTDSQIIVRETIVLEVISNIALALMLLSGGLTEIIQASLLSEAELVRIRIVAGVVSLANSLFFLISFFVARKELAGAKQM